MLAGGGMNVSLLYKDGDEASVAPAKIMTTAPLDGSPAAGTMVAVVERTYILRSICT